jgi:predicted O-linked N-acetylglucosamine transferase (SPINDLY family)
MAVPGSRLYLKARQLRDKGTAEQIASQFAARGIGRSSLELAPATVTIADHFGAYGRVDVALDPFPYNGTTTTCEALWMGVPVVTFRGARHAGRVGASLLAAVGLHELIATDEDGYVERAATLASSRERLGQLRVGLRERMRRSELCDAAGFARSMEGAYRRMWRAWCAAEPQDESSWRPA